MVDTRGMDDGQYAEHMRERRGEPLSEPLLEPLPELSGAVLGRGAARTVDGDGDWMVWVTVSDRHPWYGEDAEDCTDGGQTSIVALLFAGESVETIHDNKNGGWMVDVFVEGETRARRLLDKLVDAATAAASSRLSGTVTSVR